jgi:acetyltransferase-like isoleucine patch superfamily enzyme
MRGLAKAVLNALAMAIVAPAALTCWVQERLLPSHAMFDLWTHVMAQLPGLPGHFLRRSFYRWLLPACAENVTIGYGALLGRKAELGPAAYVGTYALIGWVQIEAGSLIGSRASIPSGGDQHRFLPSGTWSATEQASLRKVRIGAHTWIGEGAVIMADVGQGCMVAAGAVVAAPLPDGVMVAGNPARYVRRVTDQQRTRADDAPVSTVR